MGAALALVPDDGTSSTCGGVTAHGDSCRRRVAEDEAFCHWHDGSAPPRRPIRGRARPSTDVDDEGGAVVEAAQAGDRRALLVSVRDALAAAIDAGPLPRDLLALSKRLLEVVAEIDALGGKPPADTSDDEDGPHDDAVVDPIAEAADTPDEPWSG